MSYSIPMFVAISIHAGSFIAMVALNSAHKQTSLPSQRIVSSAQIIHVSTAKAMKPSEPTKVVQKDKIKEKPKANKKLIADNTIPLPAKEDVTKPSETESFTANDGASSDNNRPGLADAGDAIPTVEGTAANYRFNPNPDYPKLSIRMREEGKVLVKALVNKDGKVEQCELMKSSGFERLDESAVATVKKWLFIAQQRNGENIASWVIVPVNFSLKS